MGSQQNNKQLTNLKTSDNNYKTSDGYIGAYGTVERLQSLMISLHILLACQGCCSDIYILIGLQFSEQHTTKTSQKSFYCHSHEKNV